MRQRQTRMVPLAAHVDRREKGMLHAPDLRMRVRILWQLAE
jgi:hypothetical protein